MPQHLIGGEKLSTKRNSGKTAKLAKARNQLSNSPTSLIGLTQNGTPVPYCENARVR